MQLSSVLLISLASFAVSAPLGDAALAGKHGAIEFEVFMLTQTERSPEPLRNAQGYQGTYLSKPEFITVFE